MFGSKRGLGRAGASVLVTALVVASLWAVTAAPAAATPGGTTGTDFWLRADRGTSTSVNGGAVQTWTDQAVPTNTVSQAAAASRPTYTAAGPNFNPALRFFDGTTSRWFGSNIDTSYTTAGKGKYSYWAVAVPDATRSGFVLSSDDGIPSGTSFDRWISYNSGGVLQGASGQGYAPAGGIAGGTTAGPKLIRIYYNQGVANGSSGWVAGVNGGGFTSTMDDTAAPLVIGALGNTGTSSFRGTVAEVIGVAGAPNDDASTNARIQSYLAAKYGVTLGDVDNAPGGNTSVASVNSAGTTYWSAPVAYQNNVTVIARDTASDFDQRVSQPSTTTTLPVALAAGAYDFAGTITPTSPATALNNLASVAIGDDNGSTAITTPVTDGVTHRMARVWRVQTSGSSPSQVSVRVPATGITLPADARTLYAVSGTSAAFNAPVTTTPLTLQGGYYVGTIPTPASGEFLTFGVRVADAGTSTIAAAPTTITADGVATSTVTVTLRDANGEPILDGGDTVTIVKNSGEGTLGGVLDNGNGTYSATLTSPTTTGTATLGFTVNGVPGAGTATVTFAPGAASATGSTIAAASASLTAGDSTPVTVTVRDVNGNALGAAGAGHAVVMTTDLGTVSAPVTDNGDGTYTATLSSTLTGTATVGFTLDTAPGTATDSVVFTPGAPTAAGSTIAAAPATVTADGTDTSTVTVTLRDQYGNLTGTPGADVAMSVVTGVGTLGGVTDVGDGTYTATVSSNTAGASAIGFELEGVAGTSTASVTFVAGAADVGTSTIAASPTTVTADGSSTSLITVTLLDANGNVVTDAGDVVALATTAGTLSAVTDNGDGTYWAELTSPTAVGSATVSFTIDDADADAKVTVAFVAGTADVGTSTIAASPTTITADGSSTSLITVTLLDANGNVVTDAGDVVGLAATAGTLSTVTDNGDGTYTATLTSPTAVGSATVSFTIDDADADATATVTFVAGTADVGTSTIAASPTSITADGSSTSLITVTLLDANGNVVSDAGDVVALATTAGTLSTVTDNGDGTYSAELTSPTAVGSATVSFTIDDADADATATVTFVAGTADVGTSMIAASPTSITADGSSTSLITVTLLDANGNVVTDVGDVVGLATTAGTLSSVTDNNDGTYTATLTSPTAVGSATVSFTIDDADADATATVTFVAGTADAGTSTIAASPTTVTADGSSTSLITVTLLDANGNVVTDAGDVVALSTTAGTLSTVTDNGDGTYSAELTSPTAVGSATVSFTIDDANADATATVAFVAGTADVGTSSIAASPTTITADGSSTSLITVTLLDAYGNVVTDAGDGVALATTAGTLSAVTDNGDGTYSAELTSPTAVGSATVSFTIDDADADATATVTFIAGTADVGTSTIAASPTSITADGSSTSLITVTLLDANGNVVSDAGDVVGLATTAGTLSAVTDNGDGTYIATLTSPTAVGSATVSFTIDDADADATATVTFVAGTVDVSTSTIAASPTSITADGSSTSLITVTLLDANGNVVTDAGDVVALATTAGTLSSVSDNGDGTYSAVLTSATAVGSATVSFTIDDADADATATVTFVAGTADVGTSTIAASPTSITADGSSTSLITVTLLDANGNVVTDAGDVVGLSTTAGILSTVSDNGDGNYTATLTSTTTAGSATISFTIDGAPADDTASVEFTAGSASPDTSTIAADPPTITADGSSMSAITVTVRDAQGNPVTTGTEIVITANAGTVGATTDNGDGTWSANLTSSTVAGSATVGFTVDGDTSPNEAIVAFTPGAADATASTISASPTSITADGVSTSTITVTLVDTNGNRLTASGGTVTMSTDAGTLGSVADNADGTYTAELTSTTAVGSAVVGFTVAGTTSPNSATVDFTAGPADPATSTITASPALIPADGSSTSTVTVTLLDANGNPTGASGGTVAITPDVGTVGAVTDNGDGTYTAIYTSPTSTTPPAAIVGFSLNGVAGTKTATVAFVAGVPSTTTSEISASPDTITADGISTSTVTISLRDGNGNPVPDAGPIVGVTTTAGTLSGVIDNGDGTYTATLTSATRVGTATVSFTIDGAGASDTAAVAFVPGAPDAGTSTIVATPTSITADGGSTSAVTVTLYDAQGNRVSAGGADVIIQTDAGTIGATTDNGDGTYTATLVSAETVGTATVGFTVNGATGSATASVAFTVGPADPGTSTIAAAPSTIENDGVAASTITVRLLDANGNALSVGGDTVALTTTLGALSAVVDNGDGTYTARLTSTVRGTATIGMVVNGVTATATTLVTAVDTAPPAAPVINGPVDGATVPGVPVISGSGEPGATVTVVDGDGNEVCSAVVAADGTWSCFPSSPLPEGATEFIATQTDPAGNTSSASDRVDVTVDRTPPASPELSPTDGKTIDGTAEPGSTVTIRDTGGNVLCTVVADSDGDFSCTPATPIPPGTVVVATATDAAGNTSEPASTRVGGLSIELERGVASPGDTQVATGRGFLPGERVSGLLTSTPVDLGTLTADAGGTVTFTFVVPADIEPGTHRVTLTGELSGDVSAEFEVPTPPAPPAAPGLSATGGRALAGPAGVAAVLMLVGWMLLLWGRRRSGATLWEE